MLTLEQAVAELTGEATPPDLAERDIQPLPQPQPVLEDA